MALRTIPVTSAGIGVGLTPLGAAECADTFKAHGLAINRTVTDGTMNVVKDLMSGKVVFGHFATHAAIRAILEGYDIVVIAGGFNQEFLVGAPGVNDLSELECARVGSGPRRDLHYFYVEYMFSNILKKPGIHVPVESDTRYQDLMDGKFKATPLSTPSAVRAREAGCKWLLDYGPHDLSHSFGGVMVRRDLLTEEPELVEDYLRSLVDGLKLYKADRDFGIQVHHKVNKVPLTVAEGTYEAAHSGYQDFPDPATKGTIKIIDFWKGEGYLPKTFTIDDLVDSGPLRKVCGVA